MDEKSLVRGVMALKWEAKYRKRFSGEESESRAFLAVPERLDEDIYEAVLQINLPGCTVLDIGTGTGDHAIFLAQTGYQVTGIDIAASAIAFAQKNAASHKVNVSFIVDNILSSSLKGQYDIVIDRGCYELIAIENLEIYLASVMRLIKPGGWFVLKTARRKRRIEAVKLTTGLNVVKLDDAAYTTLDGRVVKARILVAQKSH